MTDKHTFLDYNSTSPLHESVVRYVESFAGMPLNPSSTHHFGRLARKEVESARKKIAECLSVFPHEITFTASATESNNTVFNNFRGEKVAISAIEHPSVYAAASSLCDVQIIPVDENGLVRLSELEGMLKAGGVSLISVMLASNENGVIQPIKEIASLAKQYSALVHTDAVQALGRISFDFSSLGVDCMTISAHKTGGMVGAGALIRRDKLSLSPMLLGGGQESNRRAGTENVYAIAAFGVIAENISDILSRSKALEGYRSEFEAELKQVDDRVIVFGEKAPRIPNTSMITMPNVKSETQLISLDIDSIAVSAGSACTSGRIEASKTLLAMGISMDVAQTAIRVSSGFATTKQDYQRLLESWKKLYNRVSSNNNHLKAA